MYIGRTPQSGNFQVCDAITTSATATYNLLVDTVAVSPETANHCIVSLNGVIQKPGATAYPSIQEQLDMQYWDKVNGTTTWKDAVAQVKSDNPKD